MRALIRERGGPSFDAPRAAGLLIQPGPLVASVSSRVTAILAARADFPLDRLADAVLVSDAIAAHASDYISGSDVGLVIEDGDGTLDFRVGPLHEGGGEGLLREMEVPGLGHSLERLVDEVSVEPRRRRAGHRRVRRGRRVPLSAHRQGRDSRSNRCASGGRRRSATPPRRSAGSAPPRRLRPQEPSEQVHRPGRRTGPAWLKPQAWKPGHCWSLGWLR